LTGVLLNNLNYFKKFKKKFQLWAWNKYINLHNAHPRLGYLFWEATLLCNLGCRHCGSDCNRSFDTKDELKTGEVISAFRQMAQDFNPRQIMVAVTGGEPLVRPDLFEIMGAVRKMGFPWGMVSNGFCVDEKLVNECRRTGLKTLVISLDGACAETHDWLRGKGSFDRAVTAIKLFLKADFLRALQVTSTFHRKNIHELDATYDLLEKMGVKDFRALSVFPNGRAAKQEDFVLTGKELDHLLGFIRKKRLEGSTMTVTYGDEGYLGAFYEKEVRNHFFACMAGLRIASILANGDISGCPNIPRNLVQGNIRTERFRNVWENRFKQFRDRSWMRTGECADCKSFNVCRGNSLHLWDFENNRTKLCHVRHMENA
jgi:radical SAM protein with 4Fe4S-binding SPASM domain